MAESLNPVNQGRPAIPSAREVQRELSDIHAAYAGDPAAENERNLRRLVQAIKNAAGQFALIFAVCNDRAEQRRLGREIGQKLTNPPVEVTLTGSEPSLLDTLLQAAGTPRPLFVYGVEQLLPSRDEARLRRETTLHEFQLRREQFRKLGRPLLLWLPEYAYTVVGQQALDFWSWQSGGFFFTTLTADDPRLEFETVLVEGLSNLPALSDGFLRRPEFDEAIGILRQHPLLNITGPAGSGKTALAIALARELEAEFPDGQLLLAAGALGEAKDGTAALLRQAIWLLRPDAALPDDPGTLRNMYLAALEDRRYFFILDDASDPMVVQALIPPAGCALVVTSRKPFWESGLAFVHLGALAPKEARDLLQRLVPGLEPARADAIVKLVDGNPLALRLAGALLAESPAREFELLQWLRPDSGGFGNALSHLLERLDPAAVKVLQRCTVFAGSFDRDAEAYVADDPENRHLLKLRNSALVAPWGFDDRFVVHESVREMARAGLAEDELFHAHLRHAQHYLDVCIQIQEELSRADSPADKWRQLLDAEWENIRAGQAWAASHYKEHEAAARLCSMYPGSLNLNLLARLPAEERSNLLIAGIDAASRAQDQGALSWNLMLSAAMHRRERKLSEAAAELSEAVEQARLAGRRYLETVALTSLARVKVESGDLEGAEWSARHARDTARTDGNAESEASALLLLAEIYDRMGRLAEAVPLAEELIRLSTRLGDRSLLARAHTMAGTLYTRMKDFSRALDAYNKALEVYDELGDWQQRQSVLHLIGSTEIMTGQVEQSVRHLEESLRLARGLHVSDADLAAVLADLGRAYIAAGDFERARHVSQQALELLPETGDPKSRGVALMSLGATTQQLGDYERSANYLKEALSIARQTGDAEGETMMLTALGRSYLNMGRYEEAEKTLDRAAELARELKDSRLAEQVNRVASELQSRAGRA